MAGQTPRLPRSAAALAKIIEDRDELLRVALACHCSTESVKQWAAGRYEPKLSPARAMRDGWGLSVDGWTA